MSRQPYALAAALGLHALIALVLRALPSASLRAPSRAPPLEIAIATTTRAPPPSPPPPSPRPSPPPPSVSTPRPHRHKAARSVVDPPAPSPEPAAAASSPSPARGPIDLFPPSVLGEAARAPSPAAPTPGAAGAAGESAQSRVDGWVDDAVAEARTRSGQVAPVWRDIERRLVRAFHPSVDALHDTPANHRVADRLRSWLMQDWAMVKRGEDGLRHPVEPGSRADWAGPAGVTPGTEIWQGTPEGLNLRAMPLQQQQAAAAAAGEPASWLRVEIEVDVDGDGHVCAARVAFPSGRRVFDRYALAAVEAEVARSPPPSSRARFVCEAGYAISRADSVGVNFDLSALFDKKLRRELAPSLRYPLQARVDTKVALEWVKPLARCR